MLRQGVHSLQRRGQRLRFVPSSNNSVTKSYTYSYHHYHRTSTSALPVNGNCAADHLNRKCPGRIDMDMDMDAMNQCLVPYNQIYLPKISQIHLSTSSAIRARQTKLSNDIYQNPKRLFSNTSNAKDKVTKNPDGGKVEEGGTDAVDASNSSSGRDEGPSGILLGALGFTTTALAISLLYDIDQSEGNATTPTQIRKHYGYDELDVDDHVNREMRGVHREVRGEITRAVLGEEAAEQIKRSQEADPSNAAESTADLVSDVINSDALQSAITSLITRVVGSSQFQTACQTLLKVS